MTDTPAPLPPASASAGETLVARPGRYYRNARFIMVLAIFAFGAYFLYDGFHGYPEKNRRLDELDAKINATTDPAEKAKLDLERQDVGSRETDTAIMLQKVLGFVLPVLGVGYMVFFLRRSRGKVVFENDTLHMPGHPPVTLQQMTQLEHKFWKKKGIAFVHYDVAGQTGRMRLDDFFYEQKPIDDMYEIIAKHFGVWEPPETEAPAVESADATPEPNSEASSREEEK